MNKYVFWSVLNVHINIALTEDLSKYAQGDTFWQAMQNLGETLTEWIPSGSAEASSVSERVKMYQETGINKIELIVSQDGDRFGIQCANSRSFFKAKSEQEALMACIETRANTSKINTGEGEQ
ncbi:MAG: hypothetical protein MUP98_21365 [Candidatus Aminicenantes bacterium]|nr:hypothetical protein [Candidatus Aminicenantes bacterium]